MTRKVGVDINLKSGDLSGLKALGDFNARMERARTEIAAIKKAGGISGIAIGAEEIEEASAKLDGYAANLVMLQREYVNTQMALAKVEDKGSDAYEQLTAKSIKLREQILGVNRAAEQTVTRLTEAGRVDFGRIGSISSPLASLASQTGAGALGGGIGIVNDFADIADQIPRVRETFSRLFDTFKAGQAATGSLAGGVGALATAIGPVTIAIAAATAVIAALGAIITHLNNQAEAAREAVRGELEARRVQIARQREINELLSEGNVQGAQGQLEQAQARFEDAAEMEREILRRIAENDAAYAALGSSFNPDARGQLRAVGEELRQQWNDLLDNEIIPAFEDRSAFRDALPDIQARADALASQESMVQALLRRNQYEREAAELIETASLDQLNARRQQVEQERTTLQSLIADLRSLGAENEFASAEIERLNTELDHLGEQDAALAAIEDMVALREQEAEAARSAVAAALDGIRAQVQMTQMLRTATVEQVEARQQAIDDELAAINAILPELERMAPVSQEAAQALREQRTRVAELTRELANLGGAVLTAARGRQIDEGVAALAEAQTASDDKIAQLRAQASERLLAIEEAYGKARQQAFTEREKAIAESYVRERDQIRAINTKYMQDDLKALERFQREEAKIVAKGNVDRLRAIEDMRLSLTQAERDNDIAAFIRIREQGELNLKRQAEDADAAAKERSEAFAREGEERRIAREEAIADIRQQAAEARAAAVQRHQEQMALAKAQYDEAVARNAAQLQAQVAAENEALKKRTDAIRDRYRLEDQLAESSARRRTDQIRAEEQQFVQSVSNRAQAESNAMQTVFNAVSNWLRSLGSQVGTVPRTVGPTPTPSPRTPFAFSPIRAVPTPFADGGIVRRNRRVLAEFEGNRPYDEAVIPLERGRLAAAGLGSITVNMPQTMTFEGAGVTADEVRTALHEVADAIIGGIQEARR